MAKDLKTEATALAVELRRRTRDMQVVHLCDMVFQLCGAVSNETPKSQSHETKSHSETAESQPWKAEGISRATYFRRRAKEAV